MSFPAITNPALPFVGAIPGGLQPGKIIRVQGVPQPSARCFSVNLQTGAGSYSQDDIGLHLSPVFTPPPRLVRNSLQSQQWGPEESHGPYFPFVPGQQFEILVLTENDEFKIAVNGQHFCEFRHRIPFQRITSLVINGDVTISHIGFDGVTTQPGIEAPPGGFAGGFCAPGAPPAISISSPAPPPPYVPSVQQPYPTQPGVSYPATPYGVPPPGSSPYGVPPVPPGSSPYGVPPHQAYQGGYPGAYPHPSKQSGGLGGLLPSGLAAGLGALAGSAGTALLGKRMGGHGHKNHGSSLASSALATGVDLLADTAASSLAAANSPYGKPRSSSPIPIGLAAGAGALAGAALLGKSPLKVGKKMKKLYKHKGFKFKHKGFKHKGWHRGGWHSSSSSSSSEEEE